MAIIADFFGGVAEWSKAPVLKTGVSRGTQGSNPCPSASSMSKDVQRRPVQSRKYPIKPCFSGLFFILYSPGRFCTSQTPVSIKAAIKVRVLGNGLNFTDAILGLAHASLTYDSGDDPENPCRSGSSWVNRAAQVNCFCRRICIKILGDSFYIRIACHRPHPPCLSECATGQQARISSYIRCQSCMCSSLNRSITRMLTCYIRRGQCWDFGVVTRNPSNASVMTIWHASRELCCTSSANSRMYSS